jgi:hypothetical protein
MIHLKDFDTESLVNSNLLYDLILKSLQNIELKVDELNNKFLEQDKIQIEQDLTFQSMIKRLDRVEELLEENEVNDLGKKLETVEINLNNCTQDIGNIKKFLEEKSLRNKAQIIDYIFKYGLIAIGGLITLKITGVLTAIFSLLN